MTSTTAPVPAAPSSPEMSQATHQAPRHKPKPPSSFPWEVVFGVCFISSLIAVLVWLYQETPPNKRLLEQKILAMYDGQNSSPLYLAILGEVYDVSSSPQFYGKEGGYAHFVGKDASRAFITGDFVNDLNDDVGDFSPEACAGLVHWRGFYRNHTVYKLKGRVVGKFFDSNGETRTALKRVEEKARKAKTLQDLQKEEEALYPRCNVRWSEAKGGAVWCDNGLYPRKVFTQREGGAPTTRCACFEHLGWSDLRQVYPDCAPEAHECKTAPPGPAPRMKLSHTSPGVTSGSPGSEL